LVEHGDGTGLDGVREDELSSAGCAASEFYVHCHRHISIGFVGVLDTRAKDKRGFAGSHGVGLRRRAFDFCGDGRGGTRSAAHNLSSIGAA
jgi:hypothetical protein